MDNFVSRCSGSYRIDPGNTNCVYVNIDEPGPSPAGLFIRQAVKDKAVAAIVFRVDSPGGSYVASDTIWREVCRAQEKGKPVIVSMGDVAGSGGYFVAMPA